MRNILLFSILAGIGSLLGSVLPILKRTWSKKALQRLMAFGAAVLIGTAFLHIVPHAFEIGSDTNKIGVGLVVAFLLIFTMEHFAMAHSCPGEVEECPEYIMGAIAFIALLFHSFIDGLIITVSSKVSLQLAGLISFVVLIHKFPDGLATSSILLGSNYSRKKIFLLSTFIALSTPLGSILSYISLFNISSDTLAFLLGFSAGTFIHVGATDIIPRLSRTKDIFCYLSFASGIVLTYII